jgi:hypothetical protein
MVIIVAVSAIGRVDATPSDDVVINVIEKRPYHGLFLENATTEMDIEIKNNSNRNITGNLLVQTGRPSERNFANLIDHNNDLLTITTSNSTIIPYARTLYTGQWQLYVSYIENSGNRTQHTKYHYFVIQPVQDLFSKISADSSVSAAVAAKDNANIALGVGIAASVIAALFGFFQLRGNAATIELTSEQMRMQLRPWIGKSDELIAFEGYFDLADRRLSPNEVEEVLTGKKPVADIAARFTIWFKNYGSLPAQNTTIRENEFLAKTVPTMDQVITSLSKKDAVTVMPSELVSYQFSLEAKSIQAVQFTSVRLFDVFLIEYEFEGRNGRTELIVEYIDGKFVPRHSVAN